MHPLFLCKMAFLIGKAAKAKYNRAMPLSEKPSMGFSFFKRETVFLPVLLLLGLGLRLFSLDGASLWIDEIYSLMVANVHVTPERLDGGIHTADYFYRHYLAWQPMDWRLLLEALKINVHMPLYYLLLNPWLHVFGNDAIGLRSFSAVCSTLMLLPIYYLGKTLGGSQRTGLFCLLAAMLVPFQIYYGQEGRMYALSLFWAALSGLAFWKSLYSQKPAAWSLLYALSLAGGLLSHYMFVFFLGFQGLYGLMWLLKMRDFKRLPWLGLGLATVLAVVWLWAPIYQVQQQGVSEEYHFAKGLVNWSRYLTALVWQPLITIAGDNPLERIFYLPLTIFLFCWLLFKPGRQPAETRVRFPVEGFLLSWIFAPLLLQIGYDLIKHTHTSIIDRYAMLISLAMCLWLGLSLNRLWEFSQSKSQDSNKIHISKFIPKLLIGCMVILAVCNVWQASPFRDEHNKDKDIRGKIAYMTQQARPDDLVMTNGPWGAALIAAYYLRQERPQQAMFYWVSPYRQQLQPLPKPALLKPYSRAWLFRYRANNERGLQQAKVYLQSLYPQLETPRDWFVYTRR